jgi:hypothetical protein
MAQHREGRQPKECLEETARLPLGERCGGGADSRRGGFFLVGC